MRRLKEKLEIFNEMRSALSQKVTDSKDSKFRQMESFQNIVNNLLAVIKGYQKYLAVVERSFVNSYENLLLLVDYKFDAVREASVDLLKIQLDIKEKKLLKTHAISLIDVYDIYTRSSTNNRQMSTTMS